MSLLYKIAKPALFALDAETAHNITLKSLKCGSFTAPKQNTTDTRLETKVLGLTFKNPVGLAAGFDKNADVIDPMLRMGFGFVEAGTVTPKPQQGNPRPRVFRDIPNQAVINRMGFPNKGLEAFHKNIDQIPQSQEERGGIIGINIGMNKDQDVPEDDYNLLVKELGHYADYLTVNISSPNTPGLRNLQRQDHMLPLLKAILDTRNAHCAGTPVLVKLAPDLTEAEQEEIADTVIKSGIDGLILTNTTLARPNHLNKNFSAEKGGLSGSPLTQASTKIIRNFYRLTNGNVPIIGCGGISSAQDAYEKIKAGASLVQIYSALIYHGPALIKRINEELPVLAQKEGFQTIQDTIGKEAS